METKWNTNQQYALGTKMACNTLSCIRQIISSRLRDVILLYSAMVRAHLEWCVQV